MSETENIENASPSVAPEEGRADEKRKPSLWKRLGKGVLWTIVGLLLLVVLTVVAVYLPPVQRWAVDKASEMLSEEMGMDVSVGKVRLRFPLDLEMGDMLAVQDGDTLLNAGSLDVSVKLLPLFKGQVEVDNVTLTDTKLHTKELIEAVRIDGNVGEIFLDAHSVDLNDGVAQLNHVRLKDADVRVALADSVPEDTTESSPVPWKLNLDDVQLENVKAEVLLTPQKDSVTVGGRIGSARLKGCVNLAEELYEFTDIVVDSTSLHYNDGLAERVKGFDASHISTTDTHLEVERVCYRGTGDLDVKVKQMSFKEQSGLVVNKALATVKMDSTQLDVKQLVLETDESDVQLSYRMDMDAFEMKNEEEEMKNEELRMKNESNSSEENTKINSSFGSKATIPHSSFKRSDNSSFFTLHLNGHFGKGDIGLFAEPYLEGFGEAWPKEQMSLVTSVSGNLKKINVQNLSAYVPNALSVNGNVSITDPTDEKKMRIDANLNTDIKDASFAKGFVPKESRSAFNIPKNMKVGGDVSIKNNQLIADVVAKTKQGNVNAKVNYGMNDESYNIDMYAENLNVNQFVPLDEPLALSGKVKAKGKGFDFFNKRTTADVVLDLSQATYGDIDVSNTNGQLALKDGIVSGNLSIDNDKVALRTDLSGKMLTDALDIHLDMNMDHCHLKELGLSDERLDIKTVGVFDAKYNMKDAFRVDADVELSEVIYGKDKIETQKFDLFAETDKDTTTIFAKTGDLYLDMHAPENLFKMIDKATQLQTAAEKQRKERSFDMNALKSFFPTATLKANIGTNNPLAQLLGIQDVKFENFNANLNCSPETGLIGDARITKIVVDSIAVEDAFFDIHQDSTNIVYKLGVKCDDQPSFKGFSAFVDGYTSLEEADAHITYFNKKEEKGADFGLHATIDSVLNMNMYPEEPILGFTRFKVNKDNHITLTKRNRLYANLRLDSQEDSCSISVQSDPDLDYLQDIFLVVQNLNLEKLVQVIPGMPNMEGNLSVDANYKQNEEKFWVKGITDIGHFAFDGTRIGNVGADFSYNPLNETTHEVDATLSHNKQNVAKVAGTYDTADNGNLDATVKLMDLPLEMAAPFIPDQIVTLEGTMGGELSVKGPTDKLSINGQLLPKGMRAKSDLYSLDLGFEDAPFNINDSRISFNRYKIYGPGKEPLTLNGWVDFANTDDILLNLSLYGRDFCLIDAPRTRKSMVFGKMYGDFVFRVNGSLDDMRMRGMVNVLDKTDMTYVMSETPLSTSYRLDDIVTFVDFNEPPSEEEKERIRRTHTSTDMNINLVISEGAKFSCEFSADKQSYVDVQGGGTLLLSITPEGVTNLTGRYTVNEGEMKYTLPIIPLKTFAIENGSYIEFTGEASNPKLNIAAAEQTSAVVSNGDSRRTVKFLAGLKVTGTLEEMELLFTIDAPEDADVKNELVGMTTEEKNKLAVGLLATGMYMSSTNESSITANNALNNFLQNEINNIAGKAFQSAVDVNVGMEQKTREDGSTRTDYSFKFSKRFFSDRLNVVVGGKVNADGNRYENESGAYIDNVSLEWRLNKGGTRYVRLYHERNYDNLIEGELIENGASIVLKKKFDKLSDLIIWKKKEE